LVIGARSADWSGFADRDSPPIDVGHPVTHLFEVLADFLTMENSGKESPLIDSRKSAVRNLT